MHKMDYESNLFTIIDRLFIGSRGGTISSWHQMSQKDLNIFNEICGIADDAFMDACIISAHLKNIQHLLIIPYSQIVSDKETHVLLYQEQGDHNRVELFPPSRTVYDRRIELAYRGIRDIKHTIVDLTNLKFKPERISLPH